MHESLAVPRPVPPPLPRTQRTFDNLRELGSGQSPGLSDLHDSGRAGDTNGVSWVVNDNTSVDGLEASPRIGVCVCACVFCVLCVYCIVCASASLT